MREIFISIRRTPFQSLTSFIIIFFAILLTLYIVGGSLFVLGLLKKVETQPQITVYYKPETPESTILTAKNALLRSEKVSQVYYIDQKQAFNIYRSRLIDNELIGELLTANIFPPSLTVQTTKPEYLQEIAHFLKNQTYVEEVQFQQSTVKRLLTLTQSIRVAVLGFTIYLFLMTIMVLITVVGFKIALRKDEFELLQLLGATKGEIRSPLHTEILTISVVATTCALAIYTTSLAFVHFALSGYLQAIAPIQIGWNTVQFTVWPLNPIYFLVLYSVAYVYNYVLCTLATWIAARRFIKSA